MAIPISFEGDELDRDALAMLARLKGTTSARLVRDALTKAYPELAAERDSLAQNGAQNPQDDPFGPGRRGPGRPRTPKPDLEPMRAEQLTQHAERITQIAHELARLEYELRRGQFSTRDEAAALCSKARSHLERLSQSLSMSARIKQNART